MFDQCKHSHLSSIPDDLRISPFVPMITGSLPPTPMTQGLSSLTQAILGPSPSFFIYFIFIGCCKIKKNSTSFLFPISLTLLAHNVPFPHSTNPPPNPYSFPTPSLGSIFPSQWEVQGLPSSIQDQECEHQNTLGSHNASSFIRN